MAISKLSQLPALNSTFFTPLIPVRRHAHEAAESGLLSLELAASISGCRLLVDQYTLVYKGTLAMEMTILTWCDTHLTFEN